MTLECVRFSAQDMAEHQSELVELLCDAVDGGASVSFIAPLAPADAAHYWQKLAETVEQQQNILVTALEAGRVVGSIILALAWQPNAPHRAEVQKLLVHSAYRRRGIASQLLQAAEDIAKSEGRWLLYLDTEYASGARLLYEKMGYTQTGVIPQHSLNSAGEYADTALFHKLLKE